MRARLVTIAALLIGGNVAAWLWAWTAFGQAPVLLGAALLAWVFGLRHAVDADHIAAIDNVVRKLVQERQTPLTVGLFFSLGHSTVVVLASLTIAAAAAGASDSEILGFKAIGGVIGTSVSVAFMLLIAAANMVILLNLWPNFRRAAAGLPVYVEGVNDPFGGGLLSRVLRPLFRVTSRSWHMYPLGFLFGLGFDTATEIGLLSLSASHAGQGMSPWDTLVFPALFTAGMTLVDSVDSILMLGVYRWGFVSPVQRLWYNFTMTAASVAVAVFIGGIEALGLIARHFGLSGGAWSLIAQMSDNLGSFGFVIIGIFAIAWTASASLYRRKRVNT